ncbi:MAG: hypothetical protein M3Y80_06905 [Verrucomicrobiota bacterium]|nr:hypothetical protein [Verrucomicrobiota bacterium]
MAEERRPQKSITDLRQEIAHSRDRLARDLSGLKYELDFPLKFRKSFQRNSKVWVSAMVLTGVVMTARMFPSKQRIKTVYVPGFGRQTEKDKGKEQKKGLLGAGLALGALRLVATLARPLVISFITKKLGSRYRTSR